MPVVRFSLLSEKNIGKITIVNLIEQVTHIKLVNINRKQTNKKCERVMYNIMDKKYYWMGISFQFLVRYKILQFFITKFLGFIQIFPKLQQFAIILIIFKFENTTMSKNIFSRHNGVVDYYYQHSLSVSIQSKALGEPLEFVKKQPHQISICNLPVLNQYESLRKKINISKIIIDDFNQKNKITLQHPQKSKRLESHTEGIQNIYANTINHNKAKFQQQKQKTMEYRNYKSYEIASTRVKRKDFEMNPNQIYIKFINSMKKNNKSKQLLKSYQEQCLGFSNNPEQQQQLIITPRQNQLVKKLIPKLIQTRKVTSRRKNRLQMEKYEKKQKKLIILQNLINTHTKLSPWQKNENQQEEYHNYQNS